MKIITNKGEFGSFRSLRDFMVRRHIEEIRILMTVFHGIEDNGWSYGIYGLDQIESIVSDPDALDVSYYIKFNECVPRSRGDYIEKLKVRLAEVHPW